MTGDGDQAVTAGTEAPAPPELPPSPGGTYGRGDGPLLLTDEAHALAVMQHPRWGDGYLEVWRIAEASRLNASQTRAALGQLERAGLVERDHRGRGARWRAVSR